jgi:peptide/nickel transport system substrate-binding protein
MRTRFNFLIVLTAFALALSVFTPAATGVFAQAQYKEAPMLAEQVTAGKLPAVDKRLPKEPMVVKPLEKVGQYGGSWRMGLRGGGDDAALTRTVGYDYLLRWDIEWKNPIPNIAKSIDVNAEATEYTVKLREGHKWSDGADFTADDIVFWYQDVAMNKDISPAPPAWFSSGGKPGEVVKVDALTVVFKFSSPHGLFMQSLAAPDGMQTVIYPAHYFKQFHINYNKEKVEEMVKAEGLKTWVELFDRKGGSPARGIARYQSAEMPTLGAWMMVKAYVGNATQVEMVRNPYYFKVDTENNQLPYIDRVVMDVGNDVETLTLKALNGEIDMQARHFNTLTNKAVLFDNQEKGNYKFFEVVPASSNAMVIHLNLAHKDKAKREIFQNKDFRIGLSYAINRQEIIDLVFVKQGVPYQAGPRPESPFYNEKLGKQYTEYDVAKANEHLDKAFPKKNADGIRLGPDEKPITIAVEVITALQPAWIDTMGLIQKYWKAVGVDMQIKTEDRTLFYERKQANDHDAGIWGGDGGAGDLFLDPRLLFPFSNESIYATPWAYWFQKDPRGEEPPAATKEQMDLYNQIKATGDAAKQAELMKKIVEIAADQFYVIGITLPPNDYGLVRNDFHNVPKTMPGAWQYPNPAPTNPEQYYTTRK